MLDLSALEPPTLHSLPSSVEPHLYAAPSFQLPAVADVSFLIGVVVVDVNFVKNFGRRGQFSTSLERMGGSDVLCN